MMVQNAFSTRAKHYIPPENRAYIRSVNPVNVNDAFVTYANPDSTSKKEIVLIKPPVLFSKNSYSTPVTMPLGLAYLAAVLSKANYRVSILDCPGFAMNKIRLTPNGKFKVQGIDAQESIKRIGHDVDIIGISVMFSQEWPYVRSFINQIREAFPHVKIIVGGEHPTALPEYTLRDCPAINYLVLGEGELALLELVHKLRNNQATDAISGVAYIKEKEFVQTGPAPRIASIKEIPWPKWDLIDINVYFQPNFSMGIGHGRNIAMLATRGCPYQCTFCSNPTMWASRYIMRPAKDVVDEIEYNIKTYNVNSIDFYDLTAIVRKDWILEFVEELKRRNIKIVWQLPSGTRSECFDAEVVERLAKCGCEFLVYAPESGSLTTLVMLKKRVHLKNMEQSVVAALRNGIVVKLNFIIGFPFEDRKSMWRTLLFVWKLALKKADDVNIATFTPYPGSELFDELEKENTIKVCDTYFEELMTQFDFTKSKTFCRHVTAYEIFLYRIIGMSLFYILSYIRVPSRIFRLIKFLFKKGPFQPRSLFEQRVYDMVARKKLSASSSSN